MTTEIILTNIACGIIGGLIASLSNHFLTKDRDAENRNAPIKIKFRLFILSQKNKIPTENFPHFYRTIKPEIKLRVQELNLTLISCDTRKIDSAWDLYTMLP